MNILVAGAWGLSGALVTVGIELVDAYKQHDAYPWDMTRHAKTRKLVKVSPSDQERKPAWLRYLVAVGVMGAIGAVTAACAASGGAIKDPIAAIGVGLGALQVPRLFALHAALKVESLVRPRSGDRDRDLDCDLDRDLDGEGLSEADRDDDSTHGRLPLDNPDRTEATRQ